MAIWGGSNGVVTFDDGALYEPSTDSWEPIAGGTSVPYHRSNHTAVWTGAEVIVFGGGYSNAGVPTALNDGGHYDPITATWNPVATLNAPQERYDHTAVWTGTEMIVWGGQYYQGGTWYRLADGARYWCNPN